MNGELDAVKEALRGIEKRNDERHVENTCRLDRILTQVTRTNGRVADLELWKRGHEEWTQAKIDDFRSLSDDVTRIKELQEEHRVNIARERGQASGKRAITGWMLAVLLCVVGPVVTGLITMLLKKMGWI